MVTLVANSKTGTKVSRNQINFEQAVELCPDLPNKIETLSNSNNGFNVIIDAECGLEVYVKDWVEFKSSGYDVELLHIVHYVFHD
jgi:hypothetical protein